jgi:Zn-dependent protease with chaperone function
MDFASTGSLLLRGSHGFVLVPGLPAAGDESDDAFFRADEPRAAMAAYALAHELGHLRQEHYLQRWGLTALAGAGALLLAPFARLRLGWRPQAAAALAMWAVLPAFFGTRALARAQEREADAVAAHAHRLYALGGLEFWHLVVASSSAPALPHSRPRPSPPWLTLWRTHPPAQERLRFFESLVYS